MFGLDEEWQISLVVLILFIVIISLPDYKK
jgi:hypothetical protein